MRSYRLDRGCVLDSSVALALALEEPSGSAAARLLDTEITEGHRLVVPPLFDVECASGIVKAVRRGRLAAEAGADALISLLQLPVERMRSATDVFKALALALDYGISAYDALYVAVGEREQLPLVTADARLVRALAAGPHSVFLLDDSVV